MHLRMCINEYIKYKGAISTQRINDLPDFFRSDDALRYAKQTFSCNPASLEQERAAASKHYLGVRPNVMVAAHHIITRYHSLHTMQCIAQVLCKTLYVS